jgi:hypothetical protein
MQDYCVNSVRNKMTCGEGGVALFWLVNTLTRVVFERTSRSVYRNSCSIQVWYPTMMMWLWWLSAICIIIREICDNI